jgi:hypothetical protein
MVLNVAAQAADRHALQADVLAHKLRQDQLGSSKAELGSLLAAVQVHVTLCMLCHSGHTRCT